MRHTYNDKTGRRQDRQVMKQEGDEAVEEKRRAVASRKRGELWKVAGERMKRVEYERRFAARRQQGELWREGELWQRREQESCDKEERTKAVIRRRG